MSYTPRILKVFPVFPVDDPEKQLPGTANSPLLPLVDNDNVPNVPNVPDVDMIRDTPLARVHGEELEEGDIYARAARAIGGGMFRAPGTGTEAPDPALLPLVDDPEKVFPVNLAPGTKTGTEAQNAPDPARSSSHNHTQTRHFATWPAAWAFGAGLFGGCRVGFHYDQAQDRYTVTLEEARPPASPLPDLPADLRKTFPSYAEAHAYGRAFVGRYRISTWRDPMTGRYAVTDLAWVEERLTQFRREAVGT